RHTRFSRDWSSDVCSSDLDLRVLREVSNPNLKQVWNKQLLLLKLLRVLQSFPNFQALLIRVRQKPQLLHRQWLLFLWFYPDFEQIGRASCRERGDGTVAVV